MTAVWTNEKIATLAEQWRLGAPASDIAALIGFSSSAVRGKRKRLGLPSRSPLALSAVFLERGTALVGHRRPDKPCGFAPAPLAGSTPRPWIQRGPRECAWPVAGQFGETWSCCLPAEPGEAYCLGHLALKRGEPWPPVDPGNVVLFRPSASKV